MKPNTITITFGEDEKLIITKSVLSIDQVIAMLIMLKPDTTLEQAEFILKNAKIDFDK